MLTIGVVQKGVDLVSVDTREDRHQPRQPEELNTAENSGTIVAGASILSVPYLSTSDVFQLTGEEGLFGFGHNLDF